jgi:hypothetical protein
MKSKEVVKIEVLQELGSLHNLVDGTMINLFNVNNEWLLSTRSNIGCTNKWSQGINFKEMFDECSKNLSVSSFVMPSISLGQFPGIILPATSTASPETKQLQLPSFSLSDYPLIDLTSSTLESISDITLPSIHLIDYPGFDHFDSSLVGKYILRDLCSFSFASCCF